MPIEFICPHCQTHLRVPDGTAGQLAACPSCQQHVPIPHANPFLGNEPNSGSGTAPAGLSFNRDASSEAAYPPPPPSASYTNPYAAPTATDIYQPETTSGELVHTEVTATQILTDTWTLVSQNLLPVAILGLILIGLFIAIQALAQGMSLVAALTMQQNEVAGVAMYILGFIVQQIVGVVLIVVPIRYTLNLIQNASSNFEGVFSFSVRTILRCLGVQFVIGLIGMAIGLLVAIPIGIVVAIAGAAGGQNGPDGLAILVLIPFVLAVVLVMLFVMARVGLAFYFLFDRGQRIIESVNSSWQFTKGNTIAFVGALFLGIIMAVVATVLTCGAGVIVTWPAVQLIYAIAYFRMTGQPMAALRT